ncbi:46503_t:CDS:2 [Gigaspora margarita]|uniref:46503_t:CDS:1 n=1 Tax=Gigaspora margarita TaxID=4874 RepID=A0ABN7U0Y1_GIGMA|nr:46503_t:CDS:2 [Gigaspora margarita]
MQRYINRITEQPDSNMIVIETLADKDRKDQTSPSKSVKVELNSRSQKLKELPTNQNKRIPNSNDSGQ